MKSFDELRKEARDVVARGGSALSLEDDRLHTIRRDVSLVIVRNILIGGNLIKNFANLESLIVAEACLQGSDSTPLEEGDKTALSDLYGWISSFILSGDEFASRSEHKQESKSALKNAELARACSAVAIRVLVLLNSVLPISKHTKPQAVIVSLAAFTDERDPWVAAEACHTATGLLQAYLDDMKQTKGGFSSVVGAVLKDHIRPLFTKSKNPAITSQGRKNIHTVQAGYDSTIVDPESKPWKYRYPYLVSVFRWILENINAALVEENWPLIIPPLLTIIDDDSTDYKTKGCELMTILLRITRSSTLARTGLGEVFENAVLPYLAYLPSLTPEEESLQLLGAAYPALIFLARTRFPGHIAIDARRKHLDKIVRQGILKGFYHAKEHVKITELLVGQITMLVDEMGIWAAKHLKDLLPLLSDVLCAPFGTAYPPLLLAAVKATQSLIISCWPRMTIYRGEALRGLVMCWCKVEEDSPEGSDTIKAALKDTIKLLTAALGDALVTGADHDNLVHGDERLSELFKTTT